MKDDAKIIADLKQQIHELEQQLSDYQHLEKKLQWLATFPEQNPNMVIETDLLGRPTYMNPEARQRFPELWQKGSSHPLLKGLRPIVAAFVDTDQEFVGREDIKLFGVISVQDASVFCRGAEMFVNAQSVISCPVRIR